MLLNLFAEGNPLVLNKYAIRLFGLNAAAYLSLIFEIYKKAEHKRKISTDGFIKVDRKYLTDVLSLSIEEQLICEANLGKLGIITKHTDDPDILKVDFQLYLSLLNESDVKLLTNVKQQMKINKPKGVKQSQRQHVINVLKDSIQCSNYELLTALRNWVDAIYAKPNGFLSKTAINVFQTTLNNYTQGDLDLALRIVQIATIQGYKDCQWAINTFERDMKNKRNANTGVRTTEQHIAEEKDLSDIVF